MQETTRRRVLGNVNKIRNAPYASRPTLVAKVRFEPDRADGSRPGHNGRSDPPDTSLARTGAAGSVVTTHPTGWEGFRERVRKQVAGLAFFDD